MDGYGLALYAFDGTNNDKDKNLGRAGDPGGPTNVSILYDIYNGNKAYAYGVGTKWEGLLGSAFGLGGQQRTHSMMEIFEEFFKCDKEIDITGFSRGAALARNFANAIATKHPDAKIRWLGVFDTVPSFGKPGNGVNLGYDFSIPPNVMRAYHIVASQTQRGGEHRENFPVHSIFPNGVRPEGSPHLEVFINGAHSDIGGGYMLYDANGDRRYGQGYRNNIANYSLKMMHQDGIGYGVPFGAIPTQYQDISKGGNKWELNSEEGKGIGMSPEPSGFRRAYGPNGGLLPQRWTYHPF